MLLWKERALSPTRDVVADAFLFDSGPEIHSELFRRTADRDCDELYVLHTF